MGVRLIIECDLYSGKYGMPPVESHENLDYLKVHVCSQMVTRSEESVLI